MNLPDEIYIVVTEFDMPAQYANLGTSPLALETTLDERCSKAGAVKQANRLSGRYGKTKIGRLVFDTDEILDLSDAMTPEEKAQPTWT
jgi:hypothetical protein